MGRQVIKQTNLPDGKPAVLTDHKGEEVECEEGLYCIWSSIVNDIVCFNMTREDVIQGFVDIAADRAKMDAEVALDRADEGHQVFVTLGGKKYARTKTFEQAYLVSVHKAGEEEDVHI